MSKVSAVSRKQASDGLPPPPKRQASMPRMYSMSEDSAEPSTSRPITGGFLKKPDDHVGLVQATGGQVMLTYRRVPNVSVMIDYVNMPANDAILGVHWLGKHKAQLDCDRGRVRFETTNRKLLEYQVIRPTLGSLIISAIQAERMIEKGCKAYLATITTAKVRPDAKLEEIQVAKDFVDVFQALTGLPPDRSDSFTIELEPRTNLISQVPYRMAPVEMA
ncbi:unnamed protein product [Arabidopsis halleri]